MFKRSPPTDVFQSDAHTINKTMTRSGGAGTGSRTSVGTVTDYQLNFEERGAARDATIATTMIL